MSDGGLKLGVLFRVPRFPVVMFALGRIGGARSLAGLGKVLTALPPSPSGRDVKVVDLTGEELWSNAEHSVWSPGFAMRRWTKKQIIDAYNASPEGHDLPCRTTSLSSRKVGDVVREICEMISHAGRRR